MLTRIICLEDIEDIDFKAFDQQLYRQKWSGYKNSFKFLNTNDVSKLTLFGATNNIQEFRRNHSNCKLSHNENSAYYIKTETEQRNRTLREKCPYLELFWSVSFLIQSKCGKIRAGITPNMDTFYVVEEVNSSILVFCPCTEIY